MLRVLVILASLAVIALGVTFPAASKQARRPTHTHRGKTAAAWHASYKRAHASAVRYRHQRDDLQARLARRVREARTLRQTTGRLDRRLTSRTLAVRSLRRALTTRTDVVEMLQLAAIAYHVDAATLIRKARCESGFDPAAKNPSSTASGVGQFLDSTWASTPYARFSVFNPVANTLAMAWMHHVGRGGEWSCR